VLLPPYLALPYFSVPSGSLQYPAHSLLWPGPVGRLGSWGPPLFWPGRQSTERMESGSVEMRRGGKKCHPLLP